jgi:hypothetical protein
MPAAVEALMAAYRLLYLRWKVWQEVLVPLLM